MEAHPPHDFVWEANGGGDESSTIHENQLQAHEKTPKRRRIRIGGPEAPQSVTPTKSSPASLVAPASFDLLGPEGMTLVDAHMRDCSLGVFGKRGFDEELHPVARSVSSDQNGDPKTAKAAELSCRMGQGRSQSSSSRKRKIIIKPKRLCRTTNEEGPSVMDHTKFLDMYRECLTEMKVPVDIC